MSKDEFRAALEALSMGQDQAAEYLCCDRSTVSRWMTGARPVPGLVAKVIEDALKQQETR